MARYRCYYLDTAEHIRSAENIEAESLDAALARAKELLLEKGGALSIEIWQGAVRLHPRKSPPS